MNFRKTIYAVLLATGIAVPGVGQDQVAGIEQAPDQSAVAVKPIQKVVVVTGARFSYELVEKWIDEYNKIVPDVQIVVESRGTNDPLKYDILAEVYQHDEELARTREYVNIGRYSVLPVANGSSAFAKVYREKGLDRDLIKQIFFHDMFVDKEKQKPIKVPYTTYTRLQKAGVPTVFAKHFGHEQKDLKGNAIAGADAHLIKAVLRDSTGVTYLPVPLIYDKTTRKPVEGLTVLPVDLDGNGRVTDDEKFYDNLDNVITRLEGTEAKSRKNVPTQYLHLSVDREKGSLEAVQFLKWVNENGHQFLAEYGYMQPDESKFGKAKFSDFASKREAGEE